MRTSAGIALLLLVSNHVMATTIICPQLDEQEAALRAALLRYEIAAVVRVARSEGMRGGYELVPPAIKGYLPPAGNFEIARCAHPQFKGDVLLAFGQMDSTGRLSIELSSRIYSAQWDMLWNDVTVRWLQDQIGRDRVEEE